MKKEIIVRDLAANNLLEAIAWYEDQQNGLGLEFLEEWESVLEFLSLYPDSCRKEYKNFRLAGLKRFPYIIIFENEPDLIVVYNVIYAGRQVKKRYKTK
jgi:toxin ParE1/3/4